LINKVGLLLVISRLIIIIINYKGYIVRLILKKSKNYSIRDLINLLRRLVSLVYYFPL